MATQRKREYTIRRFIDVDNETVAWTAYDRNDKLLTDYSARIDARKLSDANRKYAELFGLNQTVSDCAALAAGATLDQKFEEMRERIAHLESGSEVWTSERRDTEGSILFRALMLKNPERDPIALRNKLREMGATKCAAMTNRPTEEMREFIEKARAESSRVSKIDTEELFSELDEV
jgi:hypothetical protein